MVDEPMRITPAGAEAAADGSAPPSEPEWRAGLADLIASIQRDLGDALDTAREQAFQAVRNIEERGAELFAALDDERSTLDSERAAEQTARAERVAALQADIDGVESEIAEARAEAEREAEATRAAARRRADSIISEAEIRAEVIIAEARERAGGMASGPAAASAPTGEGQHDVQGRLRGLSDRVGRLLSRPATDVAAAGVAADVAAAASVSSAPEIPPPAALPPTSLPRIVYEDLAPPPAVEDAGHDTDEGSAVVEQPSAFAVPPPPPPPAPVVELPSSGSSSWFKDDLAAVDAEPLASEAASETVAPAPSSPVWPPPDSQHVADEEDDDLGGAPTGLHAVPMPPREESRPTLLPTPAAEAAAAADSAPAGPVTQTLIFQAVPNFQAALALERSLKAMSEVREVRVADFDERQLTFQVTHELGGQLPRVLLTQRGSELELVDSRPERVEFVFRS